jgi:hypothetical protein
MEHHKAGGFDRSKAAMATPSVRDFDIKKYFVRP